MNTVNVANVLWACGFAANCTLLSVLIAKKRWDFPVFAAMIAYQVIETASLWIVRKLESPSLYFWCFWIFALFDYLFQLAVVGEMAFKILRPRGRWIRMAGTEFLIWATLGLAAAGAVAALLPVTEYDEKGWETKISIFTSLLTCELFLALSLAANRLRLQRRDHVIAIGQGLAVWGIAALMGDVAGATLKSGIVLVVASRARMMVYIAVALLWAKALWLEQRREAPPTGQVLSLLSDFVHEDQEPPT